MARAKIRVKVNGNYYAIKMECRKGDWGWSSHLNPEFLMVFTLVEMTGGARNFFLEEGRRRSSKRIKL